MRSAWGYLGKKTFQCPLVFPGVIAVQFHSVTFALRRKGHCLPKVSARRRSSWQRHWTAWCLHCQFSVRRGIEHQRVWMHLRNFRNATSCCCLWWGFEEVMSAVDPGKMNSNDSYHRWRKSLLFQQVWEVLLTLLPRLQSSKASSISLENLWYKLNTTKYQEDASDNRKMSVQHSLNMILLQVSWFVKESWSNFNQVTSQQDFRLLCRSFRHFSLLLGEIGLRQVKWQKEIKGCVLKNPV